VSLIAKKAEAGPGKRPARRAASGSARAKKPAAASSLKRKAAEKPEMAPRKTATSKPRKKNAAPTEE
jgi:hypothetical protein